MLAGLWPAIVLDTALQHQPQDIEPARENAVLHAAPLQLLLLTLGAQLLGQLGQLGAVAVGWNRGSDCGHCRSAVNRPRKGISQAQPSVRDTDGVGATTVHGGSSRLTKAR